MNALTAIVQSVNEFVRGGRKWKGFQLLCVVVVIFVIGGYVKSETIIRDMVLGLFAVLGASTAGEKFAGNKQGKESVDGNNKTSQ